MSERGFGVLTFRTRRNISLVLFIALLLVSAGSVVQTTTEAGLRDGVYTGKAKGLAATLRDPTITEVRQCAQCNP